MLQTNRQTHRYKAIFSVTFGYRWLRVVMGGYGCLRMLKDVYEWLRVVKDGDGRLRVQSEAKHYKQTDSALSLHIDHHYL